MKAEVWVMLPEVKNGQRWLWHQWGHAWNRRVSPALRGSTPQPLIWVLGLHLINKRILLPVTQMLFVTAALRTLSCGGSILEAVEAKMFCLGWWGTKAWLCTGGRTRIFLWCLLSFHALSLEPHSCSLVCSVMSKCVYLFALGSWCYFLISKALHMWWLFSTYINTPGNSGIWRCYQSSFLDSREASAHAGSAFTIRQHCPLPSYTLCGARICRLMKEKEATTQVAVHTTNFLDIAFEQVTWEGESSRDRGWGHHPEEGEVKERSQKVIESGSMSRWGHSTAQCRPLAQKISERQPECRVF